MASSLEGQPHSPTSQERPITASHESKEHHFASNEENFLFPLRMLRMEGRDGPVGSGLAMHTGRTEFSPQHLRVFVQCALET